MAVNSNMEDERFEQTQISTKKKKSTKIAIDRNAKLPLIALTPFFSLKSKYTKIFDGGKFKYGRRKICIDPREVRILY